jgi:uncharacterized protein YndB with AHSA1/START domain
MNDAMPQGSISQTDALSQWTPATWVDGDVPTLRLERQLRHPVEKVWRAVTEPAGLKAWFPFEVGYTSLEPGARIAFGEPGSADGDEALQGEILEVDPPRLFAFTWGEDRLRIELRPDGDDVTELTFLHTFGDRYGAASFASGWDTCLNTLALWLEGRDLNPGDMDAQHERYVGLLGLDEPEVERTADGWTLRAERQLVRPEADARAVIDRLGGWGGEGARIEFTEGTGHGARLVVTVTGSTAGSGAGSGSDTPGVAKERWRERLNRLGAELSTSARP